MVDLVVEVELMMDVLLNLLQLQWVDQETYHQ